MTVPWEHRASSMGVPAKHHGRNGSAFIAMEPESQQKSHGSTMEETEAHAPPWNHHRSTTGVPWIPWNQWKYTHPHELPRYNHGRVMKPLKHHESPMVAP